MLLVTCLSPIYALIAIPVGMLFSESLSAFWSDCEEDTLIYTKTRPSLAVLIPAHNEQRGLAATIHSLTPQLEEQDTIVVIADNCSDETAQIAHDLGAVVLERENRLQQGKGYAVEYGLQALSASPPDAVFIVDADCKVYPHTLDHVAALIGSHNRPVQVSNLLELPSSPTVKEQISVFAFLVNTFVRPKGLSHLQQPFTLHGTGMAFPWSVIVKADLASSNLAEDMQLSLNLAIRGHLPLFCPAGKVTSPIPTSDDDSMTQRTRWEHGHLQILLTQVPRLIGHALRERRVDLLVLAMDVSIPPLSLLILIWGGLLTVSLAIALVSHHWILFVVACIQGAMLLISILSAWARFGQAILPFSSLLQIPQYLLWKIPVYLRFLAQPQKSWIRTKR